MQADNRNVAAGRKRVKRFDGGDLLVFLIPCVQFVQLQIVGTLSGPDLLLLATFIILAFRGKIRVAAPASKAFFVLGCLWLASQCVTDIVRHSPFADYARGWSNIGMTLVNLAVIWTLLYGRTRRLVLYGWGLVAGTLLTYFFRPDDFTRDYPWKFGLAYPVTLAVFLVASSRRVKGPWPIVMAGMIGVINVYLGSRNTGGACLAAALYLFFTPLLRRSLRKRAGLKFGTVVALAISMLVGAVGIFWGYDYAASTGMLGFEAEQKYQRESGGKYGVLLGGRSELLASIPAVYDSPILGHGSWAKDPQYLLMEVRGELALGYKGALDISKDQIESGIIPAHSYLFQAWVDAGIAGAIFWVWVFAFAANALMRAYPATVLLLPVASFIVFSMLWDILFSPYGTAGRTVVPYYIVLLATCVAMAPRGSARASNGKATTRQRLHLEGRAKHV
jgi:hypothetical protein